MENRETQAKNREVVSCVGDLVEGLYSEVAVLPMSDQAKNALIMVMMGEVLKQNGQQITFLSPVKMHLTESPCAA